MGLTFRAVDPRRSIYDDDPSSEDRQPKYYVGLALLGIAAALIGPIAFVLWMVQHCG
jgi:hypothetical protein